MFFEGLSSGLLPEIRPLINRLEASTSYTLTLGNWTGNATLPGFQKKVRRKGVVEADDETRRSRITSHIKVWLVSGFEIL